MPEPTYLDRFAFGVFQFSNQNSLIEAGDRILVSVSGGVDSICLLLLLDAFRLKVDLNLRVAHFHHGLREESDEEAEFVQQLATARGIPVTIRQTGTLKGQKGMQQKARQWRYEQLHQLRRELNCNKIALGHHLDDLVETQIWRMMRGGSLFSLNPIQAKNLPLIRPLLNTAKADLQNYLKEIGQNWREDLSNESHDYTRNWIRHKIIPEMDTCAGGKLAEKLLGLNTDAIYLKQLFDECVPPEWYQTDEIEFDSISDLNPLLSQELIHRFLLYHHETEITRANIEKIYQLVLSGKGNWSIALKQGVNVQGNKKRLTIHKHADK